MEATKDVLRERMLGSLLGGMVGDAVGARLEFIKAARIPEDDVQHALTLPGGGMLGVGPGQFTDDSELMLALLTALAADTDADANDTEDPVSEGRFPDREIAKRYIEWHRSMPFDMGMTCARAFGFVGDAEECRQNAARYSSASESNGALMRCAPIACWGVARGMSERAIAECARRDADLSHPSPVCREANAMFCALLSRAFRSPPDASPREIAVRLLHSLLLPPRQPRARRSADGEEEAEAGTHPDHPVLRSWIASVPDDIGMFHVSGACTVNVGHVKHAVMLTVATLKKVAMSDNDEYGYGYTEALCDVLRAGGDTDTNACICGYMLGSVLGRRGLPSDLCDKVLAYDCSAPRSGLCGHVRPPTYRARNVLPLLERLLHSDQ